ncbi:ANTAR domain-containing protein [Cellulomonas sp. URHB0016]
MGRFAINPVDGRCQWSDGMFEIHGMAPGEVVPTLDLMLRHVEAADRDRVLDQIAQGARDGTPFGCQYRLLDLSGAARTVTLTGSGEAGIDGERVVSGFLVDTTAAQQRATASRVNTELALALESHAVIDQAKGVLMLGYGIDGEAAFELLRWGSQQRNLKLVTLARRLVAAVRSSGGLSSGSRRRLDDVFFASLTEDPSDQQVDRQPPALQVTFTTVDGVPAAIVEGPVDLATAGELSAALTQLLVRARRPGSVVMDLRGVSHLGSVGVSVLTTAHRRAADGGVRLRLVLSESADLGLAGAQGLDLELVPTTRSTPAESARLSEPPRQRHG